MSNAPLFTVFTPTYNRAHTLHRVFDSLQAQTLRDFEWLVVDDGSADNTPALIAGWTESAGFPVRYYRQENSGKHVAQNRAVDKAQGFLFATLDSDDALTPDALERIGRVWNGIPEKERAAFCGIGGLCRDQHGAIMGERFPTSPFDCTFRDLVYVHRIRGTRWGVTLTQALREYPFPEIAGSQFVPEGLVGLQMSRKYKRRYVNEVFRIYYVDEPQDRVVNLSSRASLAGSAPGRLCYYLWLLNHEIEHFPRLPMRFVKAALMAPVAGWLSGRSFAGVVRSLENKRAKALVLALAPLAWLFYRSNRGGGAAQENFG